jgi:hypothetical protein
MGRHRRNFKWPGPAAPSFARQDQVLHQRIDLALPAPSAAYCKTVMALPFIQQWIEAARAEPEELEELDVEF